MGMVLAAMGYLACANAQKEYLALRHLAENEVAGQYRGFLKVAQKVLAELRSYVK
jgi:hypothetical protein